MQNNSWNKWLSFGLKGDKKAESYFWVLFPYTPAEPNLLTGCIELKTINRIALSVKILYVLL